MDVTAETSPLAPIARGGRDGAGRFQPGNACGRGNVSASRAAHWRKVIDDAITDDDMHDGCRAMVEMMRSGDVAAFKALIELTVGRPKPMVDDDDRDEVPLIIEPPLPMVGMN